MSLNTCCCCCCKDEEEEEESENVSLTRSSISIRWHKSFRKFGSRSPIVFCALTVPPKVFTRRPERTFHDVNKVPSFPRSLFRFSSHPPFSSDSSSSPLVKTFESKIRSSSSDWMKFSIRRISFCAVAVFVVVILVDYSFLARVVVFVNIVRSFVRRSFVCLLNEVCAVKRRIINEALFYQNERVAEYY